MKAVLVVDRPDSCYECRFRQAHDGVSICIVQNKDTKAKIKPRWCPLKSSPPTRTPPTEIVRCADCKFARDKGLEKVECLLSGVPNTADGFCNHGVNKGDAR